jgi:hypothetical protein
VDDAVRDYIEGIAPEHRPLFDRLHALILAEHPDADVVLRSGRGTIQLGPDDAEAIPDDEFLDLIRAALDE